MSLTVLGVFLFAEANLAFAKVDPYSYKNRYLMPIYEKTFVTPSSMKKDEPKSKSLPDAAPRTPGISKDSNGNVIINSAHHKFRTKIDRKGNTESLKSGQVHIKRDYEGNLTEKREFEGGSGVVTVKNEFGEIKGFEEYGQGSKILRARDEDYYLMASFGYHSRTLVWIVDELTLTKTIYDRYGRAMYDVDFEGNKVATYEYNGNNKLKWKIDLYDNKTIYDDKGWKALFTLDFEGNVIATFNYNDPQNSYRLSSIVDQYGNIVEYEKGQPQQMKDYQGNILKQWVWQGTKLIMSKELITNSLFGLETNRVTWYKNSKPTQATIDGITIKKWLRIEGKTAGIWDMRNKELTLVKDDGLVDKEVYLGGDLTNPPNIDIQEVNAYLENWAESNWLRKGEDLFS